MLQFPPKYQNSALQRFTLYLINYPYSLLLDWVPTHFRHVVSYKEMLCFLFLSYLNLCDEVKIWIKTH